MSSTITSNATNWTITSPAGQQTSAAKNVATADLEDDGTVVVTAYGARWAGNIMTLSGLVGATPALRFADLVNNHLTGLPPSLATTVYARYNAVGAPKSTSLVNTVFFDVLGMAADPDNYGIVPTYANGTGWTIQKAGIYRITATHRRTFTVATTNLTTLNVLRNGANDGTFNYINISTQSGSPMALQYVNYRTWAVGDVVRISHTQSTLNNVNHIQWEVVFELISDTTSTPAISGGSQRFTFNGVEPSWTTGDPNLIIPFDTLQYTTGPAVAILTSPGVVTIQEAGMYLVTANVTAYRTAGAAAVDNVPVNIEVNGSQIGGRFRGTANGSQRFTLFGTNTVQCAVGDTISFVLPNYVSAPPATTYQILNSTSSLGCALSVTKL